MVKNCGILGGRGPETTAIFYTNIIRKWKERMGASYPPLGIWSLPDEHELDSFFDILSWKDYYLNIAIRGIQALSAMNCDFIVIPCNTLHYFYQELQNESKVPLINLIEKTVQKISKDKIRKVGLLGTHLTMTEPTMYMESFKKLNIDVIIPNDEHQTIICNLIFDACNGNKGKNNKQQLQVVIENLIQYGSEAIVFGCTDLQLLLKPHELKIPIYDTLEILEDEVIAVLTNQ
jgi:aspartate racemase